jgi:hypothetical protein
MLEVNENFSRKVCAVADIVIYTFSEGVWKKSK